MDADSGPTLLRRVLDNAGAVSPSLGEPLYARLIGDPTWHEAIPSSLFYSKDRYRTEADRRRALAILARLELPADTPRLHELRAALGGDASS